jgi:signal transduction histidine kinase
LESQIDVESSLSDISLKADSDRITQVIVNLTQNALKYTKTGGIKISARDVSEFPRSQTTKRIKFEIEDTGLGIKMNE